MFRLFGLVLFGLWLLAYSLTCLFACLFACLLVCCLIDCFIVCVFVCVFVCLSACLPACLPVCLSVCLSLCLFVCLFVCMCAVCVCARVLAFAFFHVLIQLGCFGAWRWHDTNNIACSCSGGAMPSRALTVPTQIGPAEGFTVQSTLSGWAVCGRPCRASGVKLAKSSCLKLSVSVA